LKVITYMENACESNLSSTTAILFLIKRSYLFEKRVLDIGMDIRKIPFEVQGNNNSFYIYNKNLPSTTIWNL